MVLFPKLPELQEYLDSTGWDFWDQGQELDWMSRKFPLLEANFPFSRSHRSITSVGPRLVQLPLHISPQVLKFIFSFAISSPINYPGEVFRDPIAPNVFGEKR
ncbi:hypothetical protein TURU_047148 [Turdus rufiventris]|nr:hypothetical protein TURU_047148 [Turdus rufiventris]